MCSLTLKESLVTNAFQGCLVVRDSRILLKHLNSINVANCCCGGQEDNVYYYVYII